MLCTELLIPFWIVYKDDFVREVTDTGFHFRFVYRRFWSF